MTRISAAVACLIVLPVGTIDGAQDDPADAAALALDDGFAALDAGETGRATDAFRRAEGLLGSAVVYGGGQRDHDDAIVRLRRGFARAYLESDDPFAAAAEADRGLDFAQTDAELWTILGIARYRLGDLEAARVALDHAGAEGAGDAGYLWGTALVAAAGNRLAEAREQGRRAIALDPRPARVLTLARWAEIDGDFGAAAEVLDAALRTADGPGLDGHRALARFYRLAAGAEPNRIVHDIPRAQVNFDLKADDEIPFVPVRINGRDEPVYVIFDTGAERNVVDADFARSIGVAPVVPGGELRGPYRRAPAGYAVVDRIELGSVVVEHVPVAVADFAALNLRSQGAYFIAAILNPAIVFRDFTVVLDYGHRRIELHRSGEGDLAYAERATRLRKTAVPFSFDANAVWPILPVSIDGARGLPFVVDTGASDVLLDRSTAGALRVEPDRVLAAAGGLTREDLGTILIDLAAATPGSVDIRGILGFPFFRGKRLVLDYPTMTLVIED